MTSETESHDIADGADPAIDHGNDVVPHQLLDKSDIIAGPEDITGAGEFSLHML